MGWKKQDIWYYLLQHYLLMHNHFWWPELNLWSCDRWNRVGGLWAWLWTFSLDLWICRESLPDLFSASASPDKTILKPKTLNILSRKDWLVDYGFIFKTHVVSHIPRSTIADPTTLFHNQFNNTMIRRVFLVEMKVSAQSQVGDFIL